MTNTGKGVSLSQRLLDITVAAAGIVAVGVLVLFLANYLEHSFFYISLESLQWIDIGLWATALTCAVLFSILVWVTLAFSVIAIVASVCVLIAIIMMFFGFSLIWPILLLLIAAWGIGQASQLD
ncbi:hypothetical protein [Shewanella colwelliana]|uniref:hypothetical protein n=1 Tax=Shewanella colwelliana TaxID=23 RepID=UPI0022AF3B24|nr:hypothetical protein [Shewanella colwelliana]MCZ4337593.1 hypothetical protein [Shewanella colwelliana]